jgi:NAD(P)-dependent dehydrogenase (short-subunit alcohol dehydrogenase family)
MKTVLITGCSSGFGLEIARYFLARDWQVVAGTETVEEGAREAVRVALLGPDGPTGTITRWKGETIPW